MENSLPPLHKNKSFLSFMTLKLLGAFNDSFIQSGFLAFSLAFLAKSEQSTAATYLGTAAFMIPVFLFSALAGELSDKYDKAKLLRFLKIFEIFIAVFIATSYCLKSETGMLVGMCLTGVEAAFFTPVRLSIVPFITGKGQLVTANSALESGSYVTKFAGFALGLIAGATINPFFPAALVILSTCGFIAASNIKPLQPAAPETVINKMFIRSTWSNLKYAKYSREVFLAVLGLAGAWCITLTFMLQLPIIASHIFNDAGQSLKILFIGYFSIGIGIGAAVASKVYKKEPVNAMLPLTAVIEAVLLSDFALILLTYTPGQENITISDFLTSAIGIHTSLCIFFICFFAAMFIVPVTAYLQAKAPEEESTRIMAANNIIAAIFLVIISVIGALCTYVFGAAGGVPFMSGLIALICIAGAILAVGILPIPMVRALTRKFLELVYHAKCDGLENFEIRKGQRTLIVANHTSFLDGVLLWTYLYDDLSFAVDTTIATRWYFKPILAMSKYYTIDSRNPMSIRSLIKEIDNGRIPVIFPEGRITTTGTLMKIYSGTAMIADKSGAEILPVIIEGSQFSAFSRFGASLRHKPRSRIMVRIMPATRFSVPEQYTGKARSSKASDLMYDLMSTMKVKASLIPENAIFGSVIDTMKTVGRGKLIVEDHNRKPLSIGNLYVKSMVMGRYFRKNEPESAVGLLMPNSVAAVVVFLGLQACGKLPCMLNFSSGSKNLLSCCDAVPLKTVYTSRTFIEAGKFTELTDSLTSHGITVKYLEDLKDKISLFTKVASFLSLLRPYRSFLKLYGKPVNPDDAAVVLFTSGSEGLPKGVVLSHRNVETNIVQLQAVLPFGVKDSVFNSMPMFHSFGLTAGTLLPLITGMKVFMYPSPLHYKNVPLLVYDTNSTALFGTDTFLKGYAEHAHPYDMYAVRFAVSGGEKLKEETINLWNDKFGIRILEGYGATETAPVISVNTNMFYRRNTAGRTLPDIETRLEPIPGITEGGRLWVRGNNVMKGYLRATNPGVIDAPEDNWYDTGDIATIDDTGFIHIQGRAKRFAKIAGEMVSLTQVETVLTKLYPEVPLAVVNVPDERKGEQLMLFICTDSANKNDIKAAFKNEGITELAIPKYIQCVDSIPLNGTGKVDYVKVKDMATAILAEK